MNSKEIEKKIEGLVADDLVAMGYDLVRVKLLTAGQQLTLQIMAERADGKGMTVEDCVQISHGLSPRLDADEAIGDRYSLEVSSPGIDRPLVRMRDFERFKGHVARVELTSPIANGTARGQRRFQGSIVEIRGTELDAEVELRTEAGDVKVPVSSIANARLVVPPQGGRASAKQ